MTGAEIALPKLVATDLDGTVVHRDGASSARTRQVLSRLRANGVVLVGATGRGPRLIELTRRDLGGADFLVLAQGAFCYAQDDRGTRLLRSATLPPEAVAEAVSLVEDRVGPVGLAVEALTEPWSPLWTDPDLVWPYPEPTESRPRSESLRQPLVKAFLLPPRPADGRPRPWATGGAARYRGSPPAARPSQTQLDALLGACRAVVPRELCEVTSAGGMVELAPAGHTKATGLALVADELGIDPADVLAFGDMPNDVPMLRWAGRAVAMANAHPEARAVADELTGSNDDDGVASYLSRLLDPPLPR